MDHTVIDDRSTNKVRAIDFSRALEFFSAKTNVLSLDCFDTLLWRRTAEPGDVFFNLQHKPLFHSLGLNAFHRMSAESRARQKRFIKHHTGEVTLNAIYQESIPSLSNEELNALAEEELAAEIESCYAFPPTVELIRAARIRGMKIIIVSDTYLTELQLRHLLSQKLPPDAFAAIDKIFCSCEHDKSKVNGLFECVVKSLNTKEILHIGDNFYADYLAPRQLQLYALHFLHEAEPVSDMLRLQATAACIMDQSIRSTQPLYNAFRGILAATPLSMNQPETLIGYASLGPIMYAFACFIRDEIEQMQRDGKQPKVLFIMRDAYLPSLACEALIGKPFGYRVRMNRFAAFAASFRTEEDIDNYLLDMGRTDRFADIARQLLLPDNVSEPLIKTAKKCQDPESEFIRLLHKKEIIRITLKKSAEYRMRLMRYLEKEIGLKAGDTLVFVDLGYSGTAQRRLTPIFKDMNVEVLGRYLISLYIPGWEKNRRGLLDPSRCDNKMLLMLVGYIAILEQLCTCNESSMINYDENGDVIYSDVSLGQQQQDGLKRIQAKCLEFIHDAKSFFHSYDLDTSWQLLRETAIAELGRMIYLPTKPELNYLEKFQFDLSLGAKDINQLFDFKKGLAGLKRRGLFYMERKSKTRRINLPAELRAASFELALTSMVQNRLNLNIRLKDMLPRQELVEAILTSNQQKDQVVLEASATHDGYFLLWAPVGTGLTLLMGKHYRWIQIESAELMQTEDFIHQEGPECAIDAWLYLRFENMSNKEGGLFECLSEDSKMVVSPNTKLAASNYLFCLVFRPTVKQTQQGMDQSQGCVIPAKTGIHANSFQMDE